MPKMVRWEKVEGSKIPPHMRDAIFVYKDTESIYYLGNFDHSNGSAYEHRWKVTDKDGTILKGQYNCCGFKLKFAPIKWATKVVDNKHEASNDNNEEEDDSQEEREYCTPGADVADEVTPTRASMEDIIAAVKEEARPDEEPVPKRRGRKPGSKNKPKLVDLTPVKKTRKKRGK